MKAKIISVVDLKKTVAEREAEALLKQLIDQNDQDKAIEVVLESAETPRKVSGIFRRAAQTFGKAVKVRTREGRLIVQVK